MRTADDVREDIGWKDNIDIVFLAERIMELCDKITELELKIKNIEIKLKGKN